MKKIVFICTGNTCRSPMAEHIFKHLLVKNGISLKEVVVSSAGIFANENSTISPKTVEALKQIGIMATKTKKSKQLTKKLVNKNTLLIPITQEHKEWVINLPNVFALSDFDGGFDVEDVFGLPQVEYDKMRDKMYSMLEKLYPQIMEKLNNLGK